MVIDFVRFDIKGWASDMAVSLTTEQFSEESTHSWTYSWSSNPTCETVYCYEGNSKQYVRTLSRGEAFDVADFVPYAGKQIKRPGIFFFEAAWVLIASKMTPSFTQIYIFKSSVYTSTGISGP